MDEAEKCRSYREDYRSFSCSNLNDYMIEEVDASTMDMKLEYKVILAVSSSFDDYGLYKEKVLYYLSDKLKTHSVVILTGASKYTDALTDKLSEEIDFIREPHEADWAKYGQGAINKSNDEMTSSADALIAFWDGKSPGINNMIKHAKKKGIIVKVIDYTQKE